MSFTTDMVALLATEAGFDLQDLQNPELQNRIRFQKIIYFVQQELIKASLGFRFNFYVHGPYSPDLAEVGREIAEDIPAFQDIRERYTLKDGLRKKLNALKGMIVKGTRLLGEGKAKEADFLELAATLHYLSRWHDKDPALLKACRERKRQFSARAAQDALDLLRQYGFRKHLVPF